MEKHQFVYTGASPAYKKLFSIADKKTSGHPPSLQA